MNKVWSAVLSSSSMTVLLDSVSVRDKILGNYENRIRKHSSPERVFEYFASVVMEDNAFMTQDDFARCITPYTQRSDDVLGTKNEKFDVRVKLQAASEKTIQEYAAYLQVAMDNKYSMEDIRVQQEERGVEYQAHLKALKLMNMTQRDFEAKMNIKNTNLPFFEFVDQDGDGLISYPEFMFFTTIRSISSKDFEIAFKMFDQDGNGVIDRYEFEQIMQIMQLRTPSGRQDRTMHRSTFPHFPHFFGQDGRDTLSYSTFQKFQKELHDAMLRIEFAQFDVDQSGELSAKEFASFLVGHANQTEHKKWLKLVAKLENVQGSISLQSFLEFNHFLTYLPEMKIAMQFLSNKDGLNKAEFHRAAQAATQQPWVTPFQIDILFTLFDQDGNGRLNEEEFIHLMQKRESGGLLEKRDLGAFEFIQKCYTCLQHL